MVSEVVIFWKAGRVSVPKTASFSPKVLLWRLRNGSACSGIRFWKNLHFLIPLRVGGDEETAYPSPAELLTQIIQRVERTQIETVYSDIRLLTDDIASCYKLLLTQLYDAGCRYVQFDGVHSVIMEDTVRLNNRVLRERPAGMYVAFHAPTDMLVQLHGADAYFLNYDCGACDATVCSGLYTRKRRYSVSCCPIIPRKTNWMNCRRRTESVLNYILETFHFVPAGCECASFPFGGR